MKTQSTFALATAVLTLAAPVYALPILDTGHVDGVGLAFEDGAWDLHIHAERAGEIESEYAPDGAVLRVLEAARTVVPSDPAFSFLGASGAPVWVLPQSEDEAESLGVLFLGIGSEEIEPGTFAGDIALSLLGVEFTPEPGGSAQGNFSLFTVDAGGVPSVSMDSGDGIGAGDFVTLQQGGHAHFSWGFTQPGFYRISYRATAALGSTPVSGDGTHSYRVRSEGAPFTVASVKGSFTHAGAEYGIKTLGSPAAEGSTTVFKVAFRGDGVVAANDSGILADRGGQTALVAREGDVAPDADGAKFKTFGDPGISAHGEFASFTANLERGSGVSTGNDQVLCAEYLDSSEQKALGLVYREGAAAEGLESATQFRLNWFQQTADGTVVYSSRVAIGTAKKNAIWRAVPNGGGFSQTLLAAEGQPFMTDLGLKTIRLIDNATLAAPAGGVSRSVSADGTITLRILFTDGTREIVRFPAALPQLL